MLSSLKAEKNFDKETFPLPKRSCTTADREVLENEMLMTKLGGTVGYCEIRLGGQRRKLVVVAGHPMEFRSFCQLAAVMLSGCTVYNFSIECDILNLWDELGYQNLNQVPAITVSTCEWEFAPVQPARKNFYHLLELLKKSQGEDAAKADFRPMLEEIGRRYAEGMVTRG
jgi:hypothetical protein